MRLQSARQGHHHRAWTEPTAWGAVAILSGVRADWMGQAQRSRLKKQLAAMSGDDLAVRARNRARVRSVRGHPKVFEHIKNKIVVSGSGKALADLTATDRIDGYLSDRDYMLLLGRYRLEKDWDGQITLRVTTFDIHIVDQLAKAGPALAALDLADSMDSRERATGIDLLDRTIGAVHA